MMPIQVLTLFCEDVREEKSGTDTLLGVFTDNLRIGIPQEPMEGHAAGLQRLGIYTRILATVDEPSKALQLAIRRPDGTEFNVSDGFTAEFIENAREDAKRSGSPVFGLIIRAIAAPFLIPNPGRHLAVVKYGDQEMISGILNLTLNSASGSEQPS